MSTHWKTWTGVALALLVFGFAAYRVRTAFYAPPGSLRIETKTGPDLDKPVLECFRADYRQIDHEVKVTGLPLASIFFVEVCAARHECRFWRAAKLTNAGMDPITQFEMGTTAERLVGYYTLDGQPLPFQLKHPPARPKNPTVCVDLPAPLAPGAADWVLRVEAAPVKLTANFKGEFTVDFPRLSNAENVIRAAALCLPAGGRLISYRPQVGAYESTTGWNGWINTRLEARAPAPFATFKLP